MFTPSRSTQHAPGPAATAWQLVADLARKHGVDPLEHTGPLQVFDPVQAAQALQFARFKAADPAADGPEVAVRAARILAAAPDAPLREKVWGLPDDPADPAAADFSDVARSLDDWAAGNHAAIAARYHHGCGRHARPRRRA